MAKVWKEADNKFLKENYLKYSNQELADMFEVTKKSIQGKLRRLGLHRKDELATVSEVETAAEVAIEDQTEEQAEEKPLFRRKRLGISVPTVTPASPPKAAYQPLELTEKRKRAIREFDNAMKILSDGDKEKAVAEFNFVKDKFPRELDIVQKAVMWIGLLTKQAPEAPETAEDFYFEGVRLSQRNQDSKALEMFEKAVSMDPEYLDALYNIACITCKSGDFETAITRLSELAEHDDRFVETATLDYDFEPVWNEKAFIELAMDYLDLEEIESE